jgi:hypothetical protein
VRKILIIPYGWWEDMNHWPELRAVLTMVHPLLQIKPSKKGGQRMPNISKKAKVISYLLIATYFFFSWVLPVATFAMGVAN